MAGVPDTRTREELLEAIRVCKAAREAAEEERDALRQVLAILDALFVALLQEKQRGGAQPLPCHMAARLV
jgi:hypothetical protein